MRGDDGESVTVDGAIARVQDTGSIVVHRAPVESDEVSTWRRQLRRCARDRGLRLSVRHCGELTYLIYNPDYEVPLERLRAGIQAVADAFDLPGRFVPAADGPSDSSTITNCAHLRLADDSRRT